MKLLTTKKSRWAQFSEFLTSKQVAKDVDEVKIEGLPQHAIKIMLSKKLGERIDEYKKLLELLNVPITAKTINEYIGELTDMIKITNASVLRVAGVYATAGDDSKFAKIMCGWDELNSIYMGRALKAKMYWGSDKPLGFVGEENNRYGTPAVRIDEIHVRNLHLAMNNHYFKKAYNVLNYCWKRADVRPPTVTVIQSGSQSVPYGQAIDVNKESERM